MNYKKRRWILATVLVYMVMCCGCSQQSDAVTSSDMKQTEEAATSDEKQTAEAETSENEVIGSTPEHVAVLSESLADAWILAGGTISATTDDAIDSDYLKLDSEVKSVGTLKTPSAEAFISNDIDFAILSANISGHLEIKDTLEQAGIKTAYYDVNTFSDYASMMKEMTEITNREDLYEKNVVEVQKQIENQIARADGTAPTVLFLRAYSTGVKAKGSDSMTGAMLKDLGCVNVVDQNESLFGDLSMEAIIQADPEYIFVTTMGDSEEDAMKMVKEMLISNPAWNSLYAVENQNYHVLPKELFHNKPNNRWGESYQILADILYEAK